MNKGYAPGAAVAAASPKAGPASAPASRGSSSTSGSRPLRRDAERNRLLILGAARAVFAHRGLDASLDEVAREAGLGVGTVYRRFPNRDALIDALLIDGVATIGRIVEESVATPRAWDGLRHFMTSMRAPEATEEVVKDLVKPPLHELVERAQAQGDLRGDLDETDVAVLEIAALGAAEFTALADPDVWRRHLTIILDGMRARPDGPAGNTPLEQPALDDEQIDACMVDWKYGTREAPRQQRHKPTAG